MQKDYPKVQTGHQKTLILNHLKKETGLRGHNPKAYLEIWVELRDCFDEYFEKANSQENKPRFPYWIYVNNFTDQCFGFDINYERFEFLIKHLGPLELINKITEYYKLYPLMTEAVKELKENYKKWQWEPDTIFDVIILKINIEQATLSHSNACKSYRINGKVPFCDLTAA